MSTCLAPDSDTSRWQAHLGLGFAARAQGSYLAERRHSGPLRVQKPLYPEGAQICHAIIVHPPGGVAGGDTLSIAVDVGASSHAVLATPGSTKWYKANQRGARQSIVLRVHEHAHLDWLPQNNIVFDAAQAELDLTLEIADSGSAIGWDAIQLGRQTGGERWLSGSLRASTTLQRPDGTLLWTERAVLDARDAVRHAPQGLDGCTVFGTLWAVAADHPSAADAHAASALQRQHQEQQREHVDQQLAALCGLTPQLRSGFTRLPGGVLLVRAVAEHMQALQALFVQCWNILRPALHGVPAQPLRIWTT